jgi:hypothetical protein
MIITGTRVRGGKFYGGTATVGDTYFNLVTLLLPGTGTNGAQNNTFLDSSTNNFTVTRNGTPTQGTFSPFSQTGWSGYFDGTGDKLSLSSSTAFGFGTGDFTIELWVFCSFNGAVQEFIDGRAADDNIPWVLGINGTGLVRTYDGTTIRASGQLTQNAWNHVAWVRASNVNTVYVNGVSVQTWTASQDFGSTKPLTIANNIGPTSEPFTGYISNLRIVKGTAVYTSAFTPSTTPLTAISGTSLLTCQSNRFIDNSTNAFAISALGDASVQAFAPFDPTQTYSNTVVGGSEYMVRTDYLTVPSNAAIKTFTGDFTIESWVYPLTTSGAAGGGGGAFIDARTNGSSAAPWIFGYGGYVAGSGFILSYFDGTDRTSSLRMPVNQWSHAAMTRQGSTLRFFINGVVDPTTYSVGGTITGGTNPLFVTNTKDYSLNSSWGSEGYWADFRIVNGTAVYTSSFTPPTAPLTAITNTTLLLNFTNSGILDATSKNNLQTVGGAQISTAQSKFGGSSMYLDGNGDYLTIPNNVLFALGTGDFTIECWVYSIAGSNNGVWQLASSAFPGTAGLAVAANGGAWTVYYGSTSQAFGFGSIGAGAWQHVALVRQSGSLYIYANGVKYTVAASDTTNYTYTTLVIGGYYSTSFLWNGYIDDFRITKGYARYTTNFTPPTQAFPTQ